ncbi:MAG: tetratricopeptide repeat protein, partial [Chloroflexi bacterium]|nr:tetratricopeptide repeat protein [Chloroflexota bacterium]
LAYLAVTGQAQPRTTVAALLWPESDQVRAYTALRRTLAALNKAIGKQWLAADRAVVGLNDNLEAGERLWVDVDHFRALLAPCDRHEGEAMAACRHCLPALNEAVGLVRGEFLEGFTLADSPDFDDWQLFQAEGLRRALAGALQKVARYYGQQGRSDEAIEATRRWLALDRLDEAAHRALMEWYARSNQRAAALRQYQECARILREEMGATPQPETVALYERILAGEVVPGGEKGQEKAAAGPPQIRYTIPAQTTPFVGREMELAEINQLLGRPECRLLTLVGPGGIGKTRLAIEAAIRQAGRFAHGVCFVPLGPANAADYLATHVADALRFSFYADGPEPKAQLLDYLRQKELLLVLDNFEHLLAGVDLLANILQSAPGVKLLVTSQERLNLMEEWLLEIAGLSCPNGEIRDVEKSSAVQLFVQRASQVQRNFLLSEEEKPYVAQICRLVGGMPLGVELASTWVRVLSCQEIAGQIEQSLDFLATSLRNLPERHRSLRAVFEHSWELLAEEERAAFRQLSVFRGGFVVAAAVAVTGASPPLLMALADKSLLQRGPDGRYLAPEVLRQYATEKFQAELPPAAQEAVREQHSDYYARFLQEREEAILGEEQARALAEIGEEIENVRQAWRWAIAAGRVDVVDRCLESLFRFYEIRSWFQEGVEAFGQVVALLEGQEDNQLALGRALSRQGRLLVRLSRLDEGRAALERSLELLRTVAAWPEVASVTSILGVVAEAGGDYGEARRRQEESLILWRECGRSVASSRGTGNVLLRLGNVAFAQGQYQEARLFYRESLAQRREIGDRRGVAVCLNNLGSIADALGEYAEARQLYQKSVAIKHDIGDRRGVAYSLNNLGYVSFLVGEYDTAEAELTECLAVFQEIGDRKGFAYALTNLGNVAFGRRAYSQAESLYRQSLAACREIGYRAGIAYALNHLGNTSRAMGAYVEASVAYREALATAVAIEATPVIMEILVEVAALLMAAGQQDQAAALLAVIASRPSSPQKTRDAAANLAAGLRQQMGEVAFEAARKEVGTLEEVVQKVIG